MLWLPKISGSSIGTKTNVYEREGLGTNVYESM